MPPMTKEMIEAAQVQEMGRVTHYPPSVELPESPVSDETTESKMGRLLKNLNRGESGNVRTQQVDPAYNDIYNAQLKAWQERNKTTYNDAIQKVAEAVGHNIRAAERTDEILKGTVFDTPGRNPFFGDAVVTHRPDPNVLPEFQDESGMMLHTPTPQPIAVNTDVQYEAPPKYAPPELTTKYSAAKKFEPTRNPSPEKSPRRALRLESVRLEKDNLSGETENIEASKTPTRTFFTMPTYLVGKDAIIGNANLIAIDGRDFATTPFSITPNYNDYTDVEYKNVGKKKEDANRPQQLVGERALDVMFASGLAEKAKQRDGAATGMWKMLDQRITNDGNFVLRAIPKNVALTFESNYNGQKIRLPEMQEWATPTSTNVMAHDKVEKLYKTWRGKNPNGNSDDFTAAFVRGTISPEKDGIPIGMYDVAIKPEFDNTIYAMATDMAKTLGLQQVDPATLTDGYSKAEQFKHQVRALAAKIKAALLQQYTPGAYTDSDLIPKKKKKK